MSKSNGITYVGMDVHKRAINAAVILSGSKDPDEQWQVANESKAIRKLVRKVKRISGGGEVRWAYEAGPCGYALQRQLEGMKQECVVVAPSLIPVKPGERVKTDRRDAKKIATMFKGDLLTEVHPPTEEEEAVRDLTRAREQAKRDLLRARHRLSKMLLRHGHIYREGRQWTQGHWEWIRRIRFEQVEAQMVLDGYILAIEQTQERVKVLDGQVEEAAGRDPYRKPVGWLRCLRGVDTVTAMTIVAELHDFRRFVTARELMAFLGLTPSEYTTSTRVRRGAITKAGNGHVRRVLVEAAWNYRFRPSVTRCIQKRREGQPEAVIAIADRAQVRLHQRYRLLREAHNKHHNVVSVAIARELVGFIWAILNSQQAV